MLNARESAAFSAFRNDTNPMAILNLIQFSKTAWFSVLAMLVSSAWAQQSEPFDYTIIATGTRDSITRPPVPFTYVVTGTGTEVWNETVTTNVIHSKYEIENGRSDEIRREYPFIPTLSGKGSIWYGLRAKGGRTGGFASIYVATGNKTLCSRVETGNVNVMFATGCDFDVLAGNLYTVHTLIRAGDNEGYAHVEIRLPGKAIVTYRALRTASDTHSASVSAQEGQKAIAPIGVNAVPKPEKGGLITGVSYAVSDDHPQVDTRIENSVVIASTTYTETKRSPWMSSASGSASITAIEGTKQIAQTTLAASNGDTVWTVTDDNPSVETWMDGNMLFARVIGFDSLTYHTADFQSPRWQIDDTEINRVLSYWRAGAYHANAEGLDGFAPGVGPTGPPRHSADYREPFWQIDDTELNRVLAYWRAGGYLSDSQGVDGFAPGGASSAMQTVDFIESVATKEHTQ